MLGGIVLPAELVAEPPLDEGLATIRVVAVDEAGRRVRCLAAGVSVHAPDNPAAEPLLMRVGGDVSVNGQVAIIASEAERVELERRIGARLGPDYVIEFLKDPEWGLEVRSGGLIIARRGFMRGATDGWGFLGLIPAQLASPGVSLEFVGEIRHVGATRSAGKTARVRTFTVTGSSTSSAGDGNLAAAHVASRSRTAMEIGLRRTESASATFPLTGHWEKTLETSP